jgi:hypothetical protein
MRVFVFAWDRYDTITTSGLLEAEHVDHTVLVHSQAHADRFAQAGRVRPERLDVTGRPKGLTFQRNAALDRMAPGEWAVFLVDDLLHVTELDGYDRHAITGTIPITTTNQNDWRARFAARTTLTQFLARCQQATSYADQLGANLVGFAGFTNPLFRAKRWKLNCLADGRAWAVRKTALRFDEHVQMIDDVCWTAQNILTFGVVLVDAWILPACRRYTTGGYGSIPARLAQKRREVAYLTATYPQVCAVKAKPGWPAGSHVVIRPAGRTVRL